MRRTFVWQSYSLEKTIYVSQFEAAATTVRVSLHAMMAW
jgi:hypothetical protein